MGLLSDFLSSPRSNKECYRYSRAQGLDFNQSKPSSVSIIYRPQLLAIYKLWTATLTYAMYAMYAIFNLLNL